MKERTTYRVMVELLSLPNMRLSELLVSFSPATSGFVVVPCMYSKALEQKYQWSHLARAYRITYTALSNVNGVVSKVACTSSVPFCGGTMSGNALCCTPPKEWPQATRVIISV